MSEKEILVQTESAPKENKMGTMPISKLLISMALPMVASMLVQALYNIVDSLYVARISDTPDELTAISLAFAAQNFMIAVAMGLARTDLVPSLKTIPIFLVVFELIAYPLAQILETNFHNLYEFEIEAFEEIRLAIFEEYGNTIGMGVHFLANLFATVAFTLVAYLIFYFAEKAYEKIKK